MAYQWAPDYSSFINTDQYPGAAWRPADYGGGSEGAAPTAAGWYTGGGYNSDSGGFDPYTSVGAENPSYWSLKDAGLWNLNDPNSDTWKFLQSAGGGGDVRTDPNALAHALMYGGQLGQAALSRDSQGRAQVEGAYKEALNGLNPEFVNKFSNAIGGATEGYWTASKQAEGQGFAKDIGDTASTLKDMFTQTPLGVALIAATGGAAAGAMGGAAEGGAAAGATAVGAETGAAASGGLGSMIGSGLNSIASPLVDMGLSQGTANAAILGAGKSAIGGGSLGDILKGAGTAGIGAEVGGALFGGGNGNAGFDDALTNEAINADTQFDNFGGGNSMPSAVPEMDPTFGGQLQQTGVGQFEQFQDSPNLASMVGGGSPSVGMPAAVPEQDPTFDGALQQTGTGQIEQLQSPDLASMTGSGSPSMPAATPEQDPTFGENLTQTGTGQFEQLPNSGGSPMGMPSATPETDPTFGGNLQELGPGVLSQGAANGLTPQGGTPSQLGQPAGTQFDTGMQPSGAEMSSIGNPAAGMTNTGLPDLQSQLGNSGVTSNPTQGGNMDDFNLGDDFGGDLNLGGGDDLSGFDDIFSADEDFGNLFGDGGDNQDLLDGFDAGNDDPSGGSFGENDEDLFDGFDAGESGSGLDGLKALLKKGFGGLGSALGKIPAGNLASGILAAKMGQKNLQGLKDMQQKAIDSDLWRPQQSRYFEPAYDAATKGIGNTAYGQSIASDTNRNMAAQGYNMSGNQMHEVAQGLNRGSMDYLKAVGPLATGRAPAGDGSGYASGVSGAYNLFNQGAQAGLGSIINGTGGATGTKAGPTLGDLAGGIKNSLSL